MANTVKLKRSATASKVPLTTDLQLGELAINTFDGKLYSKKNAGTDAIVDFSGSVTSVATGTGLTGGPVTTTGTISLANTAVTAGSYTNTNITVDAQGRITSASNGAAGGVTSFSAGTTGLTPSTGTTGAITLAGTLAVANGGTGVTTSTGTGSTVLSTSPSFTTPVLGTPTSGTLTNCTGYTFANLASKPTTISGFGITDAPTLSGSNALTGANTFTNATGQIFRQAATQDGVLIRGRAGGTTSLNVEIIPGTLTASRVLTAPDVTGTIITTGDTGSVTNTMLAGSIANAKLANSTVSGVALGGTLSTLTLGTGLSGTSYNGSAAVTAAVSYGTTATTACVGNDSRLSDTRANPNAVTFDNGGAGGVSGSTYTGSAVLTVSYNTLGAPSTTGTGASGNWGINVTGSSASCTGNAATVSTITSGQVTTALGYTPYNNTNPNGYVSIPAGTAMLFAQTSAPTGWTKSITHDDKALRVVSGTASSGGSTAFSSVFASRTPGGTVGATTLAESQIPSHSHGFTASVSSVNRSSNVPLTSTGAAPAGGTTGGTGGGGSHNHSFTGTAMDFAVQYVDVIIATKN